MNIEYIAADVGLEEMIKPVAVATLEHVYQEACEECAKYVVDSPEHLALSKFVDKIDSAIARMKE